MKKGGFRKRRLTADLLLAVFLVVFALSALFLFRACREAGDVVVVSVDGETVAEYPLGAPGVYSINGGTNILRIFGGEAFIESADCPDGLCVRSGKISLRGDRVVCLPNRVMIEIRGGE